MSADDASQKLDLNCVAICEASDLSDLPSVQKDASSELHTVDSNYFKGVEW